jgi:predicted RNA-binding Zn ribbon-like protein
VSPDLKQIPLDPEIELVVDFVNTLDVEDDEDALGDGRGAATWLGDHAPIVSPAPRDISPAAADARGNGGLNEAERERLIALREALRALLRANNGGAPDPAATAALREAAGRSRYGVELDAGGRLALAPLADRAAAGFEARLLLAVQRIQDGGEWARLKACPAGDCQWAFYDSSRNRSRTWCSMGVCGNRQKTRRYRARSGV